MEFLLELVGFIIGGLAGVGIVTLFKKKQLNKENEKVVTQVVEINKKNEEMTNQVIENLKRAAERVNELEKLKNDKPKTDQELADWFNNRKSDNKH